MRNAPDDTETVTVASRLWRALASMRHARRSLSGKLMVVMLTTTAIALAAAGAALLLSDLRNYRTEWADNIDTESAILSLAVQPALSFNDREGAQRNLNALRARASIRAAALYGMDGTLFAQYVRPGEIAPPVRAPALAPGVHIHGGRVELVRRIIQGGESLKVAADPEAAIAAENPIAVEHRQARQLDGQTLVAAVDRPSHQQAAPGLVAGERALDIACGVEV